MVTTNISSPRLVLSLLAFAWLLASSTPGYAQTSLQSIGVPSFTRALPVENGWIDTSNGGLHLAETNPKAVAQRACVSADLSSEAPAEALILNSYPPPRDSEAAARSLSPRSGLPGRSAESHRRKWLALTIAQHGAAMFDAWSTRRDISTGYYHEVNPSLRPFAGNTSFYAAIQVGPLVFDYLGRRMMTSQHGWLKRTWWIPQALSAAMSIRSGAHNLIVR